mgnify:CR=1 FL=1
MSDDAEKAAPGAISINIFGKSVEGRQPTLEELAELRKAGVSDRMALKKLAKACIPSFRDLLKEKPACAYSLGAAVLAASGSTTVDELLEEELEGEMAAGWVKAETTGFRNLHAFRYCRSDADDVEVVVELILREPSNDREIDEYLREELKATGPKRFIKKLCVWGAPSAHEAVAAIEAVAPGLYNTLALVILQRAGLTSDVTLGEA